MLGETQKVQQVDNGDGKLHDPSILVGSGQFQVPVVAGNTSTNQADNTANPTAHNGQQTTGESELVVRAEQAELTALVLATIVEIHCEMDGAANLENAAAAAAHAVRDQLAGKCVLVGWKSEDSAGIKLVAQAGSGPPLSQEVHRLAEAACEEVLARGTLTIWPAQKHASRHALMAVSQFGRRVHCESMVAAPLTAGRDGRAGVLIAVDCEFPAVAERLIDGLRDPLGSKLDAYAEQRPSRIESLVRQTVNLFRGERRKFFSLALTAITLLMVLPVRYRISGSCELQPVQRRFVAAPFDGPLKAAMVRPGDLVLEEQLLATINPREIEYKLAGVRADLSRAQQEQKGMMADHDIAGSKLAALESARLRYEKELLEYQRSHLEIRSPIRGIVVSGDLEEAEGTPLSRGETLFEIAPLGQMVVEVAIPEEDFPHVRRGMPVDFYVYSLPNRKLSGTLQRIHPRAELRDHDNVFIGEVFVSDPRNLLRPGMRGKATITGDRHSLGWNLFHKAYHAVRTSLVL